MGSRKKIYIYALFLIACLICAITFLFINLSDNNNNKEFEFMKRWYLGHEGNPQGKSQAEISGLNKMQREIKRLEAQIEGMENPSDGIKAELERRRKLYEEYRRRLVHELMELD